MQLKTWAMKILSLTLFVMVASCSASPKQADISVLEVGSQIEIQQLKDQFGKDQLLKSETVWLIFSHDMASSKLIKAALDGKSSEDLNKQAIQYYADISGMPSLISRFIAIPKMKKLKYSIILGREEGDLAQFPRQEDMATMIELKDGKVISIQFHESAMTVLPIMNQPE